MWNTPLVHLSIVLGCIALLAAVASIGYAAARGDTSLETVAIKFGSMLCVWVILCAMAGVWAR